MKNVMYAIIKTFFISSGFIFIFFATFAQEDNHHEVGVELTGASVATNGASFGGAVKYAYVIGDQIAVGPSVRLQYLKTYNQTYGFKGSRFTWGGGAFLHFRFLDWLFLGTEIEVLKNPYTHKFPQKKWALTALVGGGITHQWGPVRLNLGILYDVADEIRDPLKSNPSPLSPGYFFRIKNAKNPNNNRLLPIIYRVAFFFPIGQNNAKKGEAFDADY